MPIGCAPAGPGVGESMCPITGDGEVAAETRVAAASAASDTRAGSIGNPRVYAFARMRDLLGWSLDTTPSFHRLPRVLGDDHLRWRGSSAQSSSECPLGRVLSAPVCVVRLWNDVRRQGGQEAEGDEAEQADDPERVRPGGFGGCQ
jgi:hypothetical protein